MFYWAAFLLVIAIVAAAFGFGGLAASAAGLAKIICFIAIVLTLITFAVGARRK